jgi:hypothetical protein
MDCAYKLVETGAEAVLPLGGRFPEPGVIMPNEMSWFLEKGREWNIAAMEGGVVSIASSLSIVGLIDGTAEALPTKMGASVGSLLGRTKRRGALGICCCPSGFPNMGQGVNFGPKGW